jgi:hypothetical protein
MANREPTVDELNGIKQTSIQWDALAHRVILVNGAGEVIKATLQEDFFTGSDCSGADGATGRVLTLANTSLSAAPQAVWVEDQLIAASDVTWNHLSASSTITFDNIEVFNADTIRVRYYI